MEEYLSSAERKKAVSPEFYIQQIPFKKIKGKMKTFSDKNQIHSQPTCITRKKKVKENYLGRRNMIPDSNLDLHKEIEIQKVKIYLFFLLLLAVKDSCLMQKQ